MKRGPLNDVLKALKAQGWDVGRTRSGHYKLTSPSGQPVFTGSTPSDARAVNNLRSTLQKNGADL